MGGEMGDGRRSKRRTAVVSLSLIAISFAALILGYGGRISLENAVKFLAFALTPVAWYSAVCVLGSNDARLMPYTLRRTVDFGLMMACYDFGQHIASLVFGLLGLIQIARIYFGPRTSDRSFLL